MKVNNLIKTVAALFVAGAVVGAYFLGKSQTAGLNDELLGELEDLRSGQADAAVVKRVSQQMENIAYQQKAVSDQQRDRAEQQSRLALDMRDRAEKESLMAREAENKAKEAALEAENERANAMNHQALAELQRDEATYAKSVADTLSYRTLGRTLGTSSLSQYEGSNRDLASQLAYAGWYFLQKYDGNKYQPEVFSALSACSRTKASVNTSKGGAVTAMCYLPGKGCVLTTDYGEIEIHRQVGARRKPLFHDKRYDFRAVWADTSNVYALTYNGPLCKVSYDADLRQIDLPYGIYMGIIDRGNGQLFLVAKQFLLLYDIGTESIRSRIDLSGRLSAFTRGEGGVIHLYYEDKSASVLDADLNLSSAKTIGNDVITCAYYSDDIKSLFLGQANGDIFQANTKGDYVCTIFGHSSRITSMLVIDGILLSAAYDKNVYIWNLSIMRLDNGNTMAQELNVPESVFMEDKVKPTRDWLVPAYMTYTGWPLAMCKFNEKEVAVGTSNGTVQYFNTSVDTMAAKIKNSGLDNMALDDWDHYIGTSVPYVAFVR